jgi:hypothetical protein|nr:MAG TPA: hypothetical protein [Caudoviricetes sp.]
MNDKKNPYPWRAWILTALIVNQVLTAIQIRQANQELWKAVIQQDKNLVQIGKHLIEHQQNDILYKTIMNHLVQEILWLIEPSL